MSNRTRVIILKETLLQSIVSDVVSTVMFFVMVGVGVVIKSEPMQWIGGVAFFIWACGKSMGYRTCSIEEARKFLDEIEKGDA